jgi:hypothetical protein
LDSAERFIQSVTDNQYYFFVGNHLNPNTIVQPTDNARDTLLSTYYNMIFGKRVTSLNTNLMVKRYDYVVGKVYAKYDHTDPNLYERPFYVIVKEGSQYDVFKCLDNNQGAVSTITPSRSNVGLDNDDFYYPNDGYRWKYMYSASEDAVNAFATPDFFPVFTDAGVKAKAIAGAVDTISVLGAGKGYSNYIKGKLGVGDIRLNGDPKIYGISTKNASTANGFYDACWMYISSGPGAGQFRMIESYSSNTTYNFVELSDAFDSSDLPQNTSTFEIYPSVRIKGDGSETIEAHARAIIDTNGNTVNHVEMLDKGRDYHVASASVMYSASVGVTELAELLPVYSPTNGHGYDSAAELGGHYVGLGISLTGTEANTVIVDNDYSQWGLIKNPQFNKVTLSLSGLNQQFSTNEQVYKVNPVQLAGTVSTMKNANNVLQAQLNVNGMTPNENLKAGDTLLFKYGAAQMLANVTGVSASAIVVDRPATFDTLGTYTANVYFANTSANGLVDGFSADKVDVTKFNGIIQTGDMIVGAETGTHGVVTGVKITDKTKGFNTFLQCTTYIGSITQGAFIADEKVFQVANAVAQANFHSILHDDITGTSRIYTTHQTGIFNTAVDGVDLTDEIVGYTSGAIAELTNKYLPDLVFGSGEILYVENFTPITRTGENTETFKLILDF